MSLVRGKGRRRAGDGRQRGRSVVVALILAALAGCTTTAGTAIPDSDHHENGRFHNIGDFVAPVATRRDWRRHSRQMLLGQFDEADDLPPAHVLSRQAALDGLARAGRAELAVTWIGHASTLIRIGGQWVLTDPALMETVGGGPVRVARMAPARPALDDLPPIDIIVISHADHDHFDMASLRRLARRNPDATVYVPLATGPLARRAGFTDVREMDWYQRSRRGSVTVEAVPAIHGVRRPPYKRNTMLWAGWILQAGDDRLYFAGDTGFGSVFEQIRERSGAVDVALVPIGAWSPRWFQAPFHVAPEEAVDVAAIMGARTAIGIHWGTFPLSEDSPIETGDRFAAAAGDGVTPLVPKVGETFVLR